MSGNEKAEFTVKPALEEPRAKVGVPYNDFKKTTTVYSIHLARLLECEQALFCQSDHGRLAVLLQAVQEE